MNWAERALRFHGSRFTFHVLRWLFHVELPPSVPIGNHLRLMHNAWGLVVHEQTTIGSDVMIHQGVTIGRADFDAVPAGTPVDGGVVIGDRVLIGANAVILFRSGELLTVGSDAIVGAGAIVTKSIGEREIWAGNPAKLIRLRRSGGEHDPEA